MRVRAGIQAELAEMIQKANAYDAMVGKAVNAAVMLCQVREKIVAEFPPDSSRAHLLEALAVIQGSLAPEPKAPGKLLYPALDSHGYAPVVGG